MNNAQNISNWFFPICTIKDARTAVDIAYSVALSFAGAIGFPLFLALIMPAFLSGCIPVLTGTVSLAISESKDAKTIETLRRAYIVHRTADGKPEEQIAAEITQIDRAWQIDLALSRGDLMALTKPNQLRIDGCDAYLIELQGETISPRCEEKWEEQRRLLKEAGIRLMPEDEEMR